METLREKITQFGCKYPDYAPSKLFDLDNWELQLDSEAEAEKRIQKNIMADCYGKSAHLVQVNTDNPFWSVIVDDCYFEPPFADKPPSGRVRLEGFLQWWKRGGEQLFELWNQKVAHAEKAANCKCVTRGSWHRNLKRCACNGETLDDAMKKFNILKSFLSKKMPFD